MILVKCIAHLNVTMKTNVKHCETCKKLHREHHIGCQGVNLSLLKDVTITMVTTAKVTTDTITTVTI